MATLDTEIATFGTLRCNLEAKHMGEWYSSTTRLSRAHSPASTKPPKSPSPASVEAHT